MLPTTIRLCLPTGLVLLPTLVGVFWGSASMAYGQQAHQPLDAEFFERRIRPVLAENCYECHSEQAGEQQGGLLLDRQAGWLQGGASEKAVVPGDLEASLLVTAIRYQDADLQMPPDDPLPKEQIELLETWILGGAPGPMHDPGETAFSRLGDQAFISQQAETHWAFQRVIEPKLPTAVPCSGAERNPIDRFVSSGLNSAKLTPSPPASAATLCRRLHYDLRGLPPTQQQVEDFTQACAVDRERAVAELIETLLSSADYGHHFGRLWLDVVRYADTDSFYRPDTRTPHYFPFAFTYRDYVIDSLNQDKPYDQFVREQLAADLIGFDKRSPEIAALGFYAVGPHANRAQDEALDDWIDLTTRGLMGLTVACARCHDHKYEPVPTADYYALRGVFDALSRVHPLDESKLPKVSGYPAKEADRRDYEARRAAIDEKIENAQGKTKGGNNLSIAQQIKETELAELLLFHPGAPAHAMIVAEKPQPPKSFIFIRGDASARGAAVSRRFLTLLEPSQSAFPDNSSGRRELAEKIVDPSNPLTGRVIVNRVWGHLLGSYLVDTPSDFGLQGSPPTHPELLDWLTSDFIHHGWSLKHLVRTIVNSRTYQQQSFDRASMSASDPENVRLWRANRKRLTIEALRDSLLLVAGNLDATPRGRPEELWGEGSTRRRAIYGYVNRFNLDPTLRAFDFPNPMQSQARRDESIVATQALFAMNSPLVIDQAAAIVSTEEFARLKSDTQRVQAIFGAIYQRPALPEETQRVLGFVQQQSADQPTDNLLKQPTAWELVAQALLMSNEFQYID